MKIQKFEDIISWQKARILCKTIYAIFGNQRDFAFRDQIIRAVISIMNNIAEGFERNSDKELKQFLYIAKGSVGEVRSMVYLASDLEYIEEKDFQNLHSASLEISKLLSGFIKTL